MNPYKLTVVVPAGYAGDGLLACMDALYHQTIGREVLEVVLIDACPGAEGGEVQGKSSADESGEAQGGCLTGRAFVENYAAGHRDLEIVYRQIPDYSPARARNCGMGLARGEYIFFLEPKDRIHRGLLKALAAFFDADGGEVDAVMPRVRRMLPDGGEGEAQIYHSHMVNTGIYDTAQVPVTLSYIPLCVRNREDLPVQAWDEALDYQEDLPFFFQAVLRTGKFGYVREALYYRMEDGDSEPEILRTYKRVSERVLRAAEKIEDLYDVEVPYGAQSCILSLLQDHVEDDSLWPHQYPEDRLRAYRRRLERVLYYIDTGTILGHIGFGKYEKAYWLGLKRNKELEIETARNKVLVLVDGEVLEKRTDAEWTLRRIAVQGSVVTIYGDFKLALFDFLGEKDTLRFAVQINQKEEIQLDVKPSFSGYPKGSRIQMNHMWGFEYEFSAEKVSTLSFCVYVNGDRLEGRIVNCYNTVFGKKLGLTSATVGNVLMTQREHRVLECKVLSDGEVLKKRDLVSEKLKGQKGVWELRKACEEYVGRRIWLYNDNFAMIDNGWFQFLHDCEKEDGIERYYVIKNREAQVYQNADERLRAHFLLYESREHKLCFLNAEKIFTAFTSGLEWRAFQHNEMYCYWDIFRAQVILLSHGVLNQYWPWSFSPISKPIDRIVISTYEEAKAWAANGFWEKDFIYSGMPRYERLLREAGREEISPRREGISSRREGISSRREGISSRREGMSSGREGVPSGRRVIVALSWRMYLAGKHEILLDAATPREALHDTYTNSSYLRNFLGFLNDARLREALEKYDVEMDVNLHPQFNLLYREHMKIHNPRVHLTDGEIRLSDYMAMISDVSSIIFDFALFKRPIQYFIPDLLEFKSGCNHFRELVLPFEDGLGPCAVTAEEAVDNLCALMENGFEMEEKYRERMEGLHIPLDDPCERIYRYCMMDGPGVRGA